MILCAKSTELGDDFSRTLAIGVQMMVPIAAIADNFPQLNVEQVCDAIAHQGGFRACLLMR